jgi:peptide-methionine (S)-S-oxide reductase
MYGWAVFILIEQKKLLIVIYTMHSTITFTKHFLLVILLIGACNANTPSNLKMTQENKINPITTNQTATFGAGCFWCVEAVFQQVKGVQTVVSGYMGGSIKNPTYREICSGLTGHAEVCQIAFDSTIVTFKELLEVFWLTHDPTTLNRQGNDVGTQYRSVVFYHNDEQKQLAETIKMKLDGSGVWPNPIMTEITPAQVFYPAEDYHQNYYNQNSEQSYCQYVIKPKLDKFNKVFEAVKK